MGIFPGSHSLVFWGVTSQNTHFAFIFERLWHEYLCGSKLIIFHGFRGPKALLIRKGVVERQYKKKPELFVWSNLNITKTAANFHENGNRKTVVNGFIDPDRYTTKHPTEVIQKVDVGLKYRCCSGSWLGQSSWKHMLLYLEDGLPVDGESG